MSSTSSRPAGDTSPAPHVFSYAQAAKGRAAATTASAIQSHQSATSGVSTPAKDISTVNTPSGGSERGDRSVNGSFEVVNKADAIGEVGSADSKPAPQAKAASSAASPSFGTASTATLPKDDKDDDFILVGGPSDSNRDRGSQGGSASADKPTEAGEGRRSKKGKKNKNTEKEIEKEKEVVKPELLVPAPLPTVNPWLVRKPISTPTVSQPIVDSSGANEASAKSAESKKRGSKSNGDESVSASQNGGLKEIPSPSKGQKKVSEVNKTKEGQSSQRPPRGSRISERDEQPVTTKAPPPVEDAMSWPTPDTSLIALEEEKRKAQEKTEKDEKDENSTNKSRPKEKWVPVPYVPSVAFNTPMPTRGGRGRGGARGGRTDGTSRPRDGANGPNTGEKTQNGLITGASATEAERPARSISSPPSNTKRPSSDPSSARKPSAAQMDKPKNGQPRNESNPVTESRNAVNAGPFDQSPERIQEQQLRRAEGSKNQRADQQQGNYQDTLPRSERNSEASLRGVDQFKENSNFKDGHSSRERNEGRSERGRGGFRGRGGHNNFPNGQPHPQQLFTNGHASQPPNGYPVRQSSGPYSPPLQPPPFSNQYPVPSRGGRGGSRSQSIPNNALYGRYPSNGAPGSQHMPPLQTANPMYDYNQMQPMSAIPYNPYVENVSVLAMVTMQLEYYFSIDNLCKDVYLRKHMDGQGFVFLAFIAGFKRIQALTQEFELLRFACQESDVIELVRGEDGLDRLRRKDGWEKWILNVEERDETCRHAGPTYFQRSSKAPYMGPMGMQNHQSMSPLAFSPNGVDPGFRPYGNGASIPPALNGNGSVFHPETPLSAAVPDFSPGLLSVNGSSDPLDAETTFPDEEVTHLTLVFNAKGNDESKAKVPYHNASSRTFSNGSIDSRSIAEELHDDFRQGRTLTNGSRVSETSPEDLRRSRSPFAPLASPTKSSFSNSPPVMWVKGRTQQAPVSEHNSEELYTSFRARALKNREINRANGTHPDMKQLYEFWSHFLCRNFNSTMYSQFRQYSFEDALIGDVSGMKNLISYYDEILNSKKKVIPETLARHYVELVMNEDRSGDRPGFEKLRAAWRNGALDMKSRKKLDTIVNTQLREELERAPHQKSDLS